MHVCVVWVFVLLKLHEADTDDIDVRLVDFGSAFVVGETGEAGPKNDSGTIAYRYVVQVSLCAAAAAEAEAAVAL